MFQTDSKRYGRAKASIKQKIRLIQHRPIEDQVKVINAILRGHFNYYGIAGNGKKIQSFWQQVKRDWKNSLSHRSQKGRVTWEKLDEILQKNPLAMPKINIDYLHLNAFVRL